MCSMPWRYGVPAAGWPTRRQQRSASLGKQMRRTHTHTCDPKCLLLGRGGGCRRSVIATATVWSLWWHGTAKAGSTPQKSNNSALTHCHNSCSSKPLSVANDCGRTCEKLSSTSNQHSIYAQRGRQPLFAEVRTRSKCFDSRIHSGCCVLRVGP